MVRHTKRKVTQLLNETFGPAVSLPSSSQNNFIRTAAVAKKFAKLLPVGPVDGSEPTETGKRAGAVKTNKLPNAVTLATTGSEYQGIRTWPEGSQSLYQVNKAFFSLEGTAGKATVSLSVSIVGEDSTTEVVEYDLLRPYWETPLSVSGLHNEHAVFSVPGTYSVMFMAPPRVALRVNLLAKEEH